MRTRSFLLTLILSTASLILSGCLDVEQRYTLNPDGSGKVDIVADLTDWTLEASDSDIKQKLRERVKDYIDSAEGVEAWKDVSYAMNGDKIHFKGTAYFPDVTKVKSKDLGLAKIIIDQLPGGDKAFRVDIESKSNFEATSSGTNGEEAVADTSQERINELIDSARTAYGMMKDMMGMVLTNLKLEILIKLPGTPKEVTGFIQRENGDLAFTVEGAKIMAVMDSMMTDSSYLRSQVTHHDKGSIDPMKNIFFPQGDLRAVIAAGATPQFDYKKEVAAAKPGHAKLLKDLNVKKSGKKKKKNTESSPEIKL